MSTTPTPDPIVPSALGVLLPNFIGTMAQAPALFAAFADAQGAFGPIVKDTHVVIRPRDKPSYEFWFASLGEILHKTRPALTRAGLALSSPIVGSRIMTILMHRDGGALWTDARAPMVPDSSEELKAYGGRWSYIKRYQTSGLLALAAEDDIDADGTDGRDGAGDGGGAGDGAGDQSEGRPPARPAAKPGTRIDKSQANHLRRKVAALGITDQPDLINAALRRCGIPDGTPFEDLTGDQFDALKKDLEKAAAL